jgi:hypothetical protein
LESVSRHPNLDVESAPDLGSQFAWAPQDGEKFLKKIRLCNCGTIQQVAERLMESGILEDRFTG